MSHQRPSAFRDRWLTLGLLASQRADLPAIGIAIEVCDRPPRTGIAAYLENHGTLEKARQLAAAASTHATQLYDRREDRVTLNEVVKINFRG
jgi:hypothetical protein